MATSLVCPECDTPLKLKTEVAPGKKVLCPGCKAIFRAPGEAAKPAHSEAVTAAPAAKASPRLDDLELIEEIEPIEEIESIEEIEALDEVQLDEVKVDDVELDEVKLDEVKLDEVELEEVEERRPVTKRKPPADDAVTEAPPVKKRKPAEAEDAVTDERPVKKRVVAKADDEGPAKKPAKADGGSMVPMLGVALTLLIVGGVVALVMSKPRGGDNAAENRPEEKPPEPPPVVTPPVVIPPVVTPPVVETDVFKAKPPAPAANAEWLASDEGDIPAPLPDGPDRPRLVLDTGGHTAGVHAAAISLDGKMAVTCGMDKTARVWDVESGRTVSTFRLPAGDGAEGALYAAAIAHDPKTKRPTWLAVAGLSPGGGKEGNPIYLIDLPHGKTMRPIKGHEDAVGCLAFSRDGKYLASGSHDNTARVFSVETGKEVAAFSGHKERIKRIAWSPDGKYIATASYDKLAAVWSMTAKRPVQQFALHGDKVVSIAWSPKGDRIATCGDDGALRVWSPTTGRQLAGHLLGTKEAKFVATNLEFLPSGAEILYGGVGGPTGGGKSGIFVIKEGTHRVQLTEHTNTVMDARLSGDGQLALSAGGDENEAFVWRTTDGSVVKKLAGPGRAVQGVGWALDGKSLSWGTTNRRDAEGNAPLEHTMRLDFVGGPRAAREEDKHMRARPSAGPYRITHDGTRAQLSAEVGGGPRGFTWTPPHKGERIYCATMIPGGRAVVGTAFGAYLLDIAEGKATRKYTGHTGAVMCVAPTVEGREGRFFFATGSNDQTICIWTPDREQPLLTLFVAGDQWAAWTAEGIYACSQNGEGLMGWQMGRGSRRLCEFLPAGRFRKSLYHPDVIRYIVPEGGVQRALLRTGKGRLVAGGGVAVTQVLPPETQVTSPAEGHSYPGGELVVEGEARSVGGNPITRMRLIVDGRPWDGDRGVRPVVPPKAGKVKASWKVDLTPGPHTLNVLAETEVSRSLSSPIHIRNTSAPDTLAPRLFILAVGVSEYEGDMKLKWAATDALAVTRSFKERHNGAFSKVETRVLTDKEATRAKIGDGLKWMADSMRHRDVGLVFFSGHGTRDPKGDFYFVPVDVNPKDLAGSCVPGEVVKRLMGNMQGRLVFMLDACHSGAAAEKGGADDIARELMSEDYGIFVMSSSMGDEFSMESSAIKAGFYTKALTDGLEGPADLNGDGVIDLSELDVYTTLAVSRFSGGMQNPVSGRPPTFQSFPVSRRR